jgi:hypothetical protein
MYRGKILKIDLRGFDTGWRINSFLPLVKRHEACPKICDQ